ncbi:MAG TPA: hypothetical protein VLA56_19090 [Pseudomonadales bacterium]|nr:hypothetical protein [Pseudomonadales bacterium]
MHRTGTTRSAALTILVLVSGVLAGCQATKPVATWSPDHCHGAREPFSTFHLVQTDVPGFKAPIMAEAVTAAMRRIGVQPVAEEVPADVTLRLSVRLVRRGGAALPSDTPDPSDTADVLDMPDMPDLPHRADETLLEAGASDPQSRFTAHADLELFDERSREIVWKGTMERAHAISGAETFHDGRAAALIEAALNELFEGLTRPCE